MRKRLRSGNSQLEFVLLGIPLLMITISVVEVSLAMWIFHNLAYATDATARYITMHGATCAQNGNTCTVTVGNVVTYFNNQALALDPAQVTVTLTDGSGTTTCYPASSYTSTSTQFPSASYNSLGSDVTVKATYTLHNPITLFWPPYTTSASSVVVAATSRQRVVF